MDGDKVTIHRGLSGSLQVTDGHSDMGAWKRFDSRHYVGGGGGVVAEANMPVLKSWLSEANDT